MKKASDLNVGGLVPLTTVDYPEHLSAVVFCQGCPWRCAYCYNTHLHPADQTGPVVWDDVVSFLGKRRNCLDAVVFSGGEPTAQSAILSAVQQVKSMGFSAALHTGGIYPKRLAALLPYLDWVGLDIKAPFTQYAAITKVSNSGSKVEESLKLLLKSQVSFECRTTVHWDVLSKETLTALATNLQGMGVKNYSVQSCVATSEVPSELGACPLGNTADEPLWDRFRSMFSSFEVR